MAPGVGGGARSSPWVVWSASVLACNFFRFYLRETKSLVSFVGAKMLSARFCQVTQMLNALIDFILVVSVDNMKF